MPSLTGLRVVSHPHTLFVCHSCHGKQKTDFLFDDSSIVWQTNPFSDKLQWAVNKTFKRIIPCYKERIGMLGNPPLVLICLHWIAPLYFPTKVFINFCIQLVHLSMTSAIGTPEHDLSNWCTFRSGWITYAGRDANWPWYRYHYWMKGVTLSCVVKLRYGRHFWFSFASTITLLLIFGAFSLVHEPFLILVRYELINVK